MTIQYPKEILKKAEMMDLGFPEEMLLRATQEKNQNFAFKLNPLAKNSPWMFITSGFDQWLQEQIKLSKV